MFPARTPPPSLMPRKPNISLRDLSASWNAASSLWDRDAPLRVAREGDRAIQHDELIYHRTGCFRNNNSTTQDNKAEYGVPDSTVRQQDIACHAEEDTQEEPDLLDELYRFVGARA